MAKDIDELRAKMPPASLARVDARVKRALEQMTLRETKNHIKLKWLRSAAPESFASIDCGEGTKFESVDDLAALIEEIGVGVASQIVIAGEADPKGMTARKTKMQGYCRHSPKPKMPTLSVR